MNRRCDTCQFWDDDYYWNRWTYNDKGREVTRTEPLTPDSLQGKCRFNAPVNDHRYDMSDGFKITRGNDWCGQWKERE